MPITRIGICAPRSAMKSNSPAPTSGSRLARAELADLRLERGDAPRREHARQQAAVHRVRGRVLEDQRARRHLDVRLDELEDAARARDVVLGVDEAALAVLVAADREEVVLLVVVERRFVAQPLVQRVRVGVDVGVVRVVVEVSSRWSPLLLRLFRSSTMRAGVSGRRVDGHAERRERVGDRVDDGRRRADRAAFADALVAARARGSASRCGRTRSTALRPADGTR